MLMNVQNIKRALPTSAAPLVPTASGPAPPAARKNHTVADVAAAEIIDGFRTWRVWTILGWDDIRQRYRRSILGPFWITLSMGIFISLLGGIYGRLFHMALATYMPYLSVGYIVWGFIAAVTNDSCVAFQEGARIIKQIKLPYSKLHCVPAYHRDFRSGRDLLQGRARLEPVSRYPRPCPHYCQRYLGIHGARRREHALPRHPADRRHDRPIDDVRHTDHVAGKLTRQREHHCRNQSDLPSH
jgi:hypothetical protein